MVVVVVPSSSIVVVSSSSCCATLVVVVVVVVVVVEVVVVVVVVVVLVYEEEGRMRFLYEATSTPASDRQPLTCKQYLLPSKLLSISSELLEAFLFSFSYKTVVEKFHSQS